MSRNKVDKKERNVLLVPFLGRACGMYVCTYVRGRHMDFGRSSRSSSSSRHTNFLYGSSGISSSGILTV